MKLLLDTHTLIWALAGGAQLPAQVKNLIASADNQPVVSAASAWEMATKSRLGKLQEAEYLAANFMPSIFEAGFSLLSISVDHALRAGRFTASYKDPFDRILAAQAIAEDIPMLSNDPALDVFGVRRIWQSSHHRLSTPRIAPQPPPAVSPSHSRRHP